MPAAEPRPLADMEQDATAAIDLAALPDELLIPGLARWLGVDTDTPPPLDINALAATARADQQYIERTGLELEA